MNFLKAVCLFFKTAGLFLITIITLLTTCLYVQCDIYKFHPSTSFVGKYLYNPYSDDTSALWIKANFHAHSIAWNHLTNGHQTPAEIEDVYRKLGYDVACISNYEHVTAVQTKQVKSLSIYEHGYNISKTHQLVFEPAKVTFFDLPFLQTASMKQSVINTLSLNSSCVALAHPFLRNGYSDEDLKKLSGYNLLEVLNHSGNSSGKWDVILSAGKPVWCIGDDDMHDARKSSEVGVCWTMINSINKNESIVDALKKGNAYSVCGRKGVAENALKRLAVNGDTMHVKLLYKANEIRLIGQHGILKHTVNNSDSAMYIFKPGDTYIRAEIINDNSKLYLNPVVRSNNNQVPSNSCTASINTIATFFYRMLVLFLCVTILMLLYNKSLRKMLYLRKGNDYKRTNRSWRTA